MGLWEKNSNWSRSWNDFQSSLEVELGPKEKARNTDKFEKSEDSEDLIHGITKRYINFDRQKSHAQFQST